MTANYIITCGKSIKIWALDPYGTLAHEILPIDPLDELRTFCYNENSNQIVCVPNSGTSLITVTCSDTSFRNEEHPLTLNARISAAVFSKTGILYFGCTSGELLQWDYIQAGIIKAYKGHTSEITSLSISMDNSHIASGSINGNIYIHNIISGVATLLKKSQPQQSIVKCIRYSNHVKGLLASAFEDGSVALWDTNKNRVFAHFSEIHKAPCMDLAFSPVNNSLLASVGLDKKVFLYDTRNKKIIDHYAMESIFYSVAFTSDGTQLLVGTSKGLVSRINFATGTQTEPDIFVAHTGGVKQISIATFPKGLQTYKAAEPDVESVQQDSSTPIATSSSVPSFFDGLISPLRNELVDSKELSRFQSPSVDSPLYNLKAKGSNEGISAPVKRLRGRQGSSQFTTLEEEKEQSLENLQQNIPDEIMTPVGGENSEEKECLGASQKMEESDRSPNKNFLARHRDPLSEKDAFPKDRLIEQQMDELKEFVKEAISDMRRSSHLEYMHLLNKMVKFNVDLQEEIKTLKEECQLNRDVVEEMLRLKEENIRLRAAF